MRAADPTSLAPATDANVEADVALLASLGQKHFHFQIAWNRVMPDGSTVNEAALDWYSALVDALLAHGITPWVSLEVFDYPQSLASAWGGWIGRPMVGAYRTFAAVIFARLAGRVSRYFCVFYGPAARPAEHRD